MQETTAVDWTSHTATRGLGSLGPTACQGLRVHSTLAVTPERLPLGLLAQPVWARDPDDERGALRLMACQAAARALPRALWHKHVCISSPQRLTALARWVKNNIHTTG